MQKEGCSLVDCGGWFVGSPVEMSLHAGLYRKIVSYVLLRSGLGSPTELAVVREATGQSLTVSLRHLTHVPCL